MSGGSQSQVQQQTPWAPAAPYLEGAMADASALYDQGGFSAAPYTGPRVAPFSDMTQIGQGATAYQAMQGAPEIGQAGTTLSSMMNPTAQTERLDAVKNNALGSAIPAATSMFSGSGMANSTLAMDTVGRAATEAVAPWDYSAYNQEQGRALQAAGMAPQIEQAKYLAPLMLQNIGQQHDAMSQSMLDAQMAQYYEGQNQERDALTNYSNLLLGYGGQGGTTTGSASESPGMMDSLGSGIQAASMLALMFSDRRLKRDILKLTKTPGGNNLYAFKYLWDETVKIGVMADEVRDAIAGYINGFAVVDYARVN